MKKTYLSLLAAATFALSGCSEKSTCVTDLSVELLENPVGVATQQPRFLWRIESDQTGVMQTGFRILVAPTEADLKSEENLMWDSGNVPSDQSVFVNYGGRPLESRGEYFWKVRVATNKGDTVWSKPARWTMALLDDGDWQAQWIGIDSAMNATDQLDGLTRLAARYLRKDFGVDGKISKARLYISGLGLYECYLNGKKVGQDVLAPTTTDFAKHVNYNVYDVTDAIKGGDNAIGVILGNGRFFSPRVSINTPLKAIPAMRDFGFPKLLAQLEIETSDGKRTVITSDESWKLTTDGPITENSEFDGEKYDANKELGRWSETGFDDSAWMPARKVAAPGGKIVAQANPNIRVMEVIDPVSINQLNDSTYILDMGQNMVGWLAVSLKGKKDKPLKMRFAETLMPDSSGNLYMDNLRGALVTDVYTPAADGAYKWEPRFTYHGFRFVELTGLDEKPELQNFKGKVIYDDMETTGSFKCSDELLNQIYSNAYWGIRGNYRSMPTDCPQRDERMGWLGDRATGCFGESFMFRQALLYEKWLQDIEDEQKESGQLSDVSPAYWPFWGDNVTWPAAYICAADMLYSQYGDTRPIEKHYASMKKWMDYVQTTMMENDLVIRDIYGDWCMPPERQDLIHSADPARKTDGRLLASSFYYRLLNTMTKFAKLSGNDADIPGYRELAAKIREAYNKEFLNAAEGKYANNTVTANIVSLQQGLVPDSLGEKVFENLAGRTEGEFGSHVSTGLIGIQFLMRGLTEHGRGDLAYAIATNKTYPSWGYMIDKGATTIWELWNGDTADPAMNSGNHVMLLGDLMTWYYECLAGIKSDSQQVGFKKIVMAPYFPEGLEWVDASTESLYGKIASHWRKTDKGLSWKIEIPCNTTALVRIPAASADAVTEGGKPALKNPAVRSSNVADGFVELEIGSGKFDFFAAK